MANHKSALKRARQNEIRRLRNRSTKTKLKKMIFEKEKIKHRIMNKKQTGVFASRLLWQEKYYG